MTMRVVIVSLLIACAFGLDRSDITPIAERIPQSSHLWILEGAAHPSEEISFKVLLKQRNLDKLNQIFWEVSDPKHPSYGKFLSTNEVTALLAPEPEALSKVVNWILESGISPNSIRAFSDFIQVTTTVQKASYLFTASFHWYQSTKTGNYRIRIAGPAHIPTELTEHIDFVVGISELFGNTEITPKHREVAVDNQITPAVLKSYYGIPTSDVANNKKNLQGIAAFSDYFSLGAFKAFDEHFGITNAGKVTREGPDCFPDDCDQYESDLDVQYVTSIGSGVPTLFLAHADGEWILDWALELTSMTDAPLVNSISYGWTELDQCEITTGCQTYGYDSEQYVTRTNTQLQALGAKGITILIADGDDGAPSLEGSGGNCPMDNSKYCPAGGCNHTSSACTELTFTLNSNNTQCYYPMGQDGDVCRGILTDPYLSVAFIFWQTANSVCNVEIDLDDYGNPHVYSTCACSALETTTSDGYTISGYVYDLSNGPLFSANYPASSPYVTSVGATQFTWNGNSVATEIVASILTGAIITTGGGFSSFQNQPSYQTAAVAAWVQNGAGLPPSYSYNTKMRGYPDIVFNGHNFLIFASNSTDDLDKCPCVDLTVDGTSCSSPSLAGLISLINDQLLNAGKSPLGFLNPLLYQMAVDKPSAFNDITSGNNNCNRFYCCQYGYQATTGWDPVGGLGSPVYSQFLQYVLGAKGVKSN